MRKPMYVIHNFDSHKCSDSTKLFICKNRMTFVCYLLMYKTDRCIILSVITTLCFVDIQTIKRFVLWTESRLDKLRQHATALSILTTELIISFYKLLYHMSPRILTNKSILEGKNNWNPSFSGAYIFTNYCILLVSSHGYYAWWVTNLDFYIEIVHKVLIYFITVFMGFFMREKRVLCPPKVMLPP